MDILLNPSLLFLIIAILFRLLLPKKKTLLYGYRTSFSKINDATWKEANRYSSNAFILVAIISYVISIIIDLSVPPTTSNKISLLIPAILIILVIIKTEMHLRKKFNDDGTEKA